MCQCASACHAVPAPIGTALGAIAGSIPYATHGEQGLRIRHEATMLATTPIGAVSAEIVAVRGMGEPIPMRPLLAKARSGYRAGHGRISTNDDVRLEDAYEIGRSMAIFARPPRSAYAVFTRHVPGHFCMETLTSRPQAVEAWRLQSGKSRRLPPSPRRPFRA